MRRRLTRLLVGHRGQTGVTTGYNAAAGYDLATGLGSVDAYALALKWSNGPAPLSIVSLSPNPMTASASNQTLTINGAGFQTGATVNVSYPGFSGSLTVTSLTATRIVATIDTGRHGPGLDCPGGQFERRALKQHEPDCHRSRGGSGYYISES